MKKKILIVDDEDDSIFIAENLLEKRFALLRARNKKDCIARLNESGVIIDLILLDLNIPDAKGFEMIEFLNPGLSFITQKT